ncbi:MAG: HEAT repeat domain-containing protein [Acidobacteriota bacterium]
MIDLLASSLSLATALDYGLKATLLLLLAWVLSLALRRASAAARHRLWTTALVAVLTLPLLSLVLPSWELPVLIPTAAPAGPADAAPTPIATPTGVPAATVVPTTPAPVADSPTRSSTLASRFDLRRALPLIWLLGSSLLLLRLLLSSLAAQRLVRTAAPLRDEARLAEVDALCRRLDLGTRVQVVEHPRITMPMAWSLRQSTVLLPTSSRDWSDDRRRVVLLHELAHIKRRDCQWLLLARLVTALHWPNPLAWVALRRLQTEREHACDDLVLTAGTAGSDYARHLLDIARAVRSRLTPSWALVAMARPSELEGRLLAILDPRVDRNQSPRRGLLGVLALLCLALPLAALQPRVGAQEESPSRATTVETKVETTVDDSAIDQRVTNALVSALDDDSPRTRAKAASSLGMAEDTRAIPALTRALAGDDSATVRGQAAWALGMIESPEAVATLIPALEDPAANVRQQAAWALGMIENPDAVEDIGAALDDDSSAVREQAAWALGMIESPDAVDDLRGALRDPVDGVREQAVWALGMIESEAAVGDLVTVLAGDSSPKVRERAAWTLGMIEDRAALDGLLDAMSDDYPEVRRQALWAVGQISH